MKRLVQCAVIAALTYVSAPAEAQILELEGAFVGSGANVGPGFRFGLVLSDRLTLGAGVSASFYSSTPSAGSIGGLGGLGGPSAGTFGSVGIAIPVDLKLWIVPPAAGTVSPTVRIVGTYARSSFGNFDETTAYGGGILAGAAYMVDEVVGISLEAGVEYMRIFQESFGVDLRGESLTVGYRASLVLRI